MAQDIVPIELGLPQGDLITLWAPRWREDGEEWEAFLGDEDDLYAFADAAALAAFVRTAEQHDLIDHPAWHVVPALNVPELVPDDEHTFDLVGVPELVADDPDSWTIGELAEIIGMVRSLADVCDLEEVHEILDSFEGFSLLEQGRLPFTGRDGERLWTELASVVAKKWDTILDAIDQLVTQPKVDAAVLEETSEELAAYLAESAEAEAGTDTDSDLDAASDPDIEKIDATPEPAADDDKPKSFWETVGIDPISIVLDDQQYFSLRCYLDDEPVFLGTNGKIDVFTSERALTRALADTHNFRDNDLAEVSTWEDVLNTATAGELVVDVVDANTYVFTGLQGDIETGLSAIEPTQLDLAVELLTDAADWAGDDEVDEALSSSESLGWLVSFVLRPDPTRLAPSAPFTDEAEAWQALVESFEKRLRVH